jgi:hypothetical protein
MWRVSLVVDAGERAGPAATRIESHVVRHRGQSRKAGAAVPSRRSSASLLRTSKKRPSNQEQRADRCAAGAFDQRNGSCDAFRGPTIMTPSTLYLPKVKRCRVVTDLPPSARPTGYHSGPPRPSHSWRRSRASLVVVHEMLRSAASHTSGLSEMVAMYVLMSAFHFAPWLKLIFRWRSGARAAGLTHEGGM